MKNFKTHRSHHRTF